VQQVASAGHTSGYEPFVTGEDVPMARIASPQTSDCTVASGGATGSLAFHGHGSGHPVVFLHGQPGGAEVWRAVQQLLVRSGVRTLAIDRPGYGSTSLAAGGFRHNADVLLEVLAHLGTPAVVVAHSWAAGPALLAAARRPEAVSGLVLCAPVGDPRSVTLLDRWLARGRVGRAVLRASLAAGAWLVHRPGGHRVLAAAGMGGVAGPEARTAALPALDRRARHAAAVEQAALVEELVEVGRAARSLRTPTVVLGGTHDGMVRPAAVKGLARAIPGARLRMLDGGHLLPIEHAPAVADAVLGLVASSRSGLATFTGRRQRSRRLVRLTPARRTAASGSPSA
jgi:pimeloyl-ACP methyl ester carboxylesterase